METLEQWGNEVSEKLSPHFTSLGNVEANGNSARSNFLSIRKQ